MMKIGTVLILIGVLSLIMQNTFYGYVDAEGILHDSIFLPLGVFACIGGVVTLLITGLLVVYHKYFKNSTS